MRGFRALEIWYGGDWPQLAVIRPEWEVTNDGGLLNPSFPAAYFAGIDGPSFCGKQAPGKRILVVEPADLYTQKRYGYDLLSEGAEKWNPEMRFYREGQRRGARYHYLNP